MKIGLGGGCHWCTEAVFQSLRGVSHVDQGWIASAKPHNAWSEAVVVTFDPSAIPLGILIAAHVHTHSSTSAHSMRSKYRSAIYTFEDDQVDLAKAELKALQSEFDQPLITSVLPFVSFRKNTTKYLDYYRSNPEKPFCERYISPKLIKIRQQFRDFSS